MSHYVDKDYYQNTYKGSIIPKDKIEEKLAEASMHIDLSLIHISEPTRRS